MGRAAVASDFHHFCSRLLFFPLIFSFLVFSTNFCAASAGSTAEKPQKYALLIGINDYDGKQFVPLKGARNDIHLVKNLLSHRFEMPEENMTILLDDQAGHVAVREAFRALAEKVAPGDMVYIHYSGHGSYTCDLNGDEDESWGRDSTWVAYGTRGRGDSGSLEDCQQAKADSSAPGDEGTRSVEPGQLNDFDILDDQINRWLSTLLAKTDRVILVSDSCHSGTVTRGEGALATRGVPIDMRAHPMGQMAVSSPPTAGIRVSASRDNEKANEYMADGEVHGLFTWFWCKTLQEAQPGDTWADIHRQTSARVLRWRQDQHPQIEGVSRQAVFEGQFAQRPRTATITYVSYDGTEAKIDEGNLLGVTPGSIYRKYDPDAESAPKSELTITHSQTTESKGDVQGTFQVGEQVILEHYQPDTKPFRVFLTTDLEEDFPLLKKLASVLDRLPTYETTEQQSTSDFVLYVVRPRREGNGFIYSKETDSLPKSFPDEDPICYILTPDEQLYHENLQISMADSNQGADRIRENLEKIARMRNLTSLTAAPGRKSPVILEVTIWEEADHPSIGDIKVEGKRWGKADTVTAEDLEEYDLKVGQLLTFSIQNQSNQTYFTYLINITGAGEIIPFFPAPYQSREHGKVGPKEERRVEAVTLIMDKPGREYVRLVASLKPLDIYPLGQSEYRGEQRSGDGNQPLTPLDVLLRSSAGLTRSVAGPISTAEWTTVQGTFRVGE